MEVNSPLSNFVKVLEQVNQTAKNYGPKLTKSESSTRAALIDPVLQSLGWNFKNPDMVELEKVLPKIRIDYALLDCSGQLVAIIEAKQLGGNLTDPAVTNQIFSYGFQNHLSNIMLTDGIVWLNYISATLSNTTATKIDISKDDPVSCADFFLQHLDAFRFWSGQPAVNPTPPNPFFQPLTSLSANLRNRKAPTALRLPDGKVVSVSHWRDILEECINFVLKVNPSLPIPLIDNAGKSKFLIDYSSSSTSGAILQTTYNGKPIYIYLNYDASNCVANALHILKYLPVGNNWQTVDVSF
jgi:hypothetical protein